MAATAWTLEWRRARQTINDGLPNCWKAWLWWRSVVFFPPDLSEPAGLQEGVGDHRHERVAMQTDPGTTFEVVEAEFLLELLMRLLADPACLDRTSQFLDGNVCG